MHFEEESSVIILRQLSTSNAQVLPYPDVFKVLLRLGGRLTHSGINALLLSKRKFLFIKAITLLIRQCFLLVILSRIL